MWYFSFKKIAELELITLVL